MNIEGKNVCVSGKLSIGTRDEVHRRIALAGGYFSTRFTHKTEILVVGRQKESNPVSKKMNMAKERGIPVINEEKLIELLGIPVDGTESR